MCSSNLPGSSWSSTVPWRFSTIKKKKVQIFTSSSTVYAPSPQIHVLLSFQNFSRDLLVSIEMAQNGAWHSCNTATTFWRIARVKKFFSVIREMKSFIKTQSIFAMTLLCPLSMIAMFNVTKIYQYPPVKHVTPWNFDNFSVAQKCVKGSKMCQLGSKMCHALDKIPVKKFF